MERLREVFRKNGIDYRLLDRTSKVALFEQKLPSGELAGYEVCKICFNEARTLWGKDLPESESVPSNESFGYEDSKAFFPADLERARRYLVELTAKHAKIIVPSKIRGTISVE